MEQELTDIRIVTIAGKLFTVKAEPNITIGDLKDMIGEALQVKMDFTMIMYKGIAWNTFDTQFSAMNYKKGDKLKLQVVLDGGM